MRAYLSAEQLAEVTPWTPDAIRRMVTRGMLQRGVHYFQPGGKGTQLIYKWSAIVALIEQDTAPPPVATPVLDLRGADPGGLDVDGATHAILRLLD